MIRTIKHFLIDKTGIAAVEFALLAPVLVVLFIGIFDFGMYLNSAMKLENTARAAAEYVRQGGDINNIEDDVIAPSNLNLTAEQMESVEVTAEYVCECNEGEGVDCAGSCGPDDYMRRYLEVSLDMSYQPSFPYPGLPDDMDLGGFVRLQIN